MARKSRRGKNAIEHAKEETIIKKKGELLATAAYVRLSVENGGNETDESLQNQIAMLHTYIAEHPDLELADSYIDNGYSGTDFERPEFLRLMEDVRTGKIYCIVVKDLSRFGRNYLETGYYLEILFPYLNVRFIAITDNFDSSRPEDRESLAIPLKNMVNAMYAKDISKKRCTAAKIKAKRPDAMPNGSAPYGYLFSSDKSVYLEDEETSAYVRLIFQWAVHGVKGKKIADRLTLIGAITPGERRKQLKQLPIQSKPWTQNMVYNILRHPVYTGNIYLGRFQQALYQSQTRRYTTLEEQTVRKNTHIPLTTQEDFQIVQDAIKNDIRQKMKSDQLNIAERERLQDSLEGMVYCGDCGKRMYFRRRTHDWEKGKREGKEKVLVSYSCESKGVTGKGCGQVVYEDFLQIVIMDQVEFLIRQFSEQDAVLRELSKSNSGKHPLISLKRKIGSLQGKQKDNEETAEKLYMNYAEGVLPAEDYVKLKTKYSEEAERLEKERQSLLRQKEEVERLLDRHRKLGEQLTQHKGSRKFDKALVHELIERISISKSGNIEIRFKCEDIIGEMLDLIEGCEEEE